jgi:hypothetical protein
MVSGEQLDTVQLQIILSINWLKMSQKLSVFEYVILYFVIRRWLSPGGWVTHQKFCRFEFLLCTTFNGNIRSSVEQHIYFTL